MCIWLQRKLAEFCMLANFARSINIKSIIFWSWFALDTLQRTVKWQTWRPMCLSRAFVDYTIKPKKINAFSMRSSSVWHELRTFWRLSRILTMSKCFCANFGMCKSLPLQFDSDRFSLPGGKVRVENAYDEIELPPISGRMGARGPLSVTLADTLNELQKFDEGYFNPEALFDLVACVCRRYADREQHDCHEFMRDLLEEIK